MRVGESLPPLAFGSTLPHAGGYFIFFSLLAFGSTFPHAGGYFIFLSILALCVDLRPSRTGGYFVFLSVPDAVRRSSRAGGCFILWPLLLEGSAWMNMPRRRILAIIASLQRLNGQILFDPIRFESMTFGDR